MRRLHFKCFSKLYKTAKKMVNFDRQNFVVDFNLSFSKDIVVRKKARTTVENFEKAKSLADFYLK